MPAKSDRATGALLRTKMLRPWVTRHLVVRPRLLTRLDQALSVPLTLISAAAGYGKTTLVSSWVESRARGEDSGASARVAWISLDENDSDLEVFLRYLVASLRTIFPASCAETLDLLQAREAPPPDTIIATLSNEISLLPDDFVVVVDDHHTIRGSAVSDLLSEFVRHWPPPMHMVLISRHDPPLPLASMRARGQLVEIRTRDLRFTEQEAAEYLERALPAPPAGPAVASLEQRTEGWIAGLQLATLSLKVADDPEAALAALLNTDTSFADYLVDELLSSQPPAVAKFLLESSMLDHFNSALCDSIMPSGDPEWSARRCIDWLERTNLFIISLDGGKEWYRYHQIFRSVLQQRAAAELSNDRLNELPCAAADWFERNGQIEEAIRYALGAGDRELAAVLMERALCDVLNREDRPTLDHWLRLLPEQFVQERPGLLMIRAWSLHFSWQLGAQANVLEKVARLLDGETESVRAADLAIVRGQVAGFSGQHAYFSNRLSRAVECCQEALALLPATWSYTRSGVLLYLGLSMQGRGEGEAAEKFLIENYESVNDKTGTYALRLLMALCLVYYAEGRDLERVRRIAQLMLDGADRKRLGVLQGWGQYLLGLVAYQQNRLDVAAGHFNRLIDFRYDTQTAVVRDGMIRLALVRHLTGNRPEAWEQAEHLDRLDLDQSGHETDQTAALRAQLALLEGDVEGAARWADAFTEPVPRQPILWQDSTHLIKAQVLVARGGPSDIVDSLEILAGMQDLAVGTHNTRLLIEVLAARAVALAAEGRIDDARSDLKRALDLARPAGFIRPFVTLGPAMQALLNDLAAQRGAPGGLRRILAAFPDGTGDRTGDGAVTYAVDDQVIEATPLVESLTVREMDVLRLMTEPLSLKEIAHKLFITHATAKRHAVNIYGKLGVNRRRDALDKAMALRILPRR